MRRTRRYCDDATLLKRTHAALITKPQLPLTASHVVRKKSPKISPNGNVGSALSFSNICSEVAHLIARTPPTSVQAKNCKMCSSFGS